MENFNFNKNKIEQEDMDELYNDNDNAEEYNRYQRIKEDGLKKIIKTESKINIKPKKRPLTNDEKIKRAFYRDNLR